MQSSRSEQLKTIVSYGLTYLLWAISLPLGGWVVYDLRDMVLTVMAVLTAKLYHSGTREAFYANLRLRAADTTSYLLMGVALVLIIVVIENFYRLGMLAGHLWSRFFLVVASCFGLLCLFGLVNDLMRLIIDAFTWRNLFYPVVYGVTAIFFFGLWRIRRIKESLAPSTPVG